mmetsp:Transcript_15791/g.20632  ORF Transcript_15791/g.20632 Transcript_15791/m.20632 type:complete len:125 (-) Transcript_15791:406-780(-)
MGTPNEACCYCGGGVTNPVASPVAAPSVNTSPPVPAPVATSSSPTISTVTTSSPSTYDEKCDGISGKRNCNQTFGCSWAKQGGTPKACYTARTTEECDFSKKRKCKRKGCKWNNSESTCTGRWD